MNSNTVVRARIDSATKARATEALQAMGLLVSDAIRLHLRLYYVDCLETTYNSKSELERIREPIPLLLRVADEKRLPFAIQVPNATTVKAMKELADGKGKRFNSAEELFRDIGV